MKKILIILDGIVAKKLLQRIMETNTGDNSYDVVYMNEAIIPEKRPSNFTFFKFDPTSKSKLAMVLDKDIHAQALIALNSKDEMLNVIKNIKEEKPKMQMSILDYWGIDLSDQHINIYKGIDVLANGMVERLPNIPVVAQNIGLKQGEIMEIRIPFGSSYAYRYIGSIEQREWKIFGLYRKQQMIKIKPSLILKPNDVILVIGKPEVLMQVYNAIGKTQGQFPMPFGHNLYLYLDLYLQSVETVKKCVVEVKYLNQVIKNQKLILRITRPTTVDLMGFIKNELGEVNNLIIEIDYGNLGFDALLKKDLRTFDIGLMMISYELFKNKEGISKLVDLRIPILKAGLGDITTIKNSIILLNDTKSYEQISPIIFDVSSQLKLKTKIFNMDPTGQSDKSYILDHFENLAKIFGQKVEIISKEKNPIRELKNQKNILQILPLKKDMFLRRKLNKLFYTNSDLLSFDIKENNQLLIPVIEN
ncbi:TrkA-C domain protein [Arcobacter nitrofigilis DSM 7299]|uniref:TrkA-C domain protein n=1 Tax=Arcobacter nitrofigilis (strain ATCC 33309 / DSM 7299 / CCUG 15893 / LMG 7604 / NCTC 12251 / CI) TaxID=572480 RepID=D5V775_ARCNC|nr:TrkA C-terminal domain-containing protein [Arcobacter nitrofigilis]ADG94495.1 TrkA-C domain protein [Arcobacter nitrofigilis DSM 7299]